MATLALIVSSTTTLAQPYFFGRIVQVCSEDETDGTSDGDQTHDLNRYAVILMFILAVGGVATTVRGWLYTLVGERLVRQLRTSLFHKIVSQDVSFFDQNKTGELMNRLSSDTTVIQNCLSVNISMGLRAAAEMVVSIALLFITSWELSCVMMAVVPALMIVVVIYGSFTKRLTKEYQDALAGAADTGAESIANSRIMKSFGAEEWESRQYTGHITTSYQKGAAKAFAYGIFAGGVGFLMGVAILVVVYYGATLVIHDKMNVGDLTSFILYTIYIAIDLGMLSGLYTEFMNAVGAGERCALSEPLFDCIC
jgi:ABC-type multidrug transport system fused ATPase/permease subunit